MDLKLIRTEADYEAALAELETLMDAEPGSAAYDRLELLTFLVEKYEDEHYPIELPDPVDAILFRMEQQGLTRRDMVAYLGSQSKVSEVLNRKRGLSLAMMRALHRGLGIPAEVLLQEPGKRLEAAKYNYRDYPFSEMFKRGYFGAFYGSLARAKEHAEELLVDFFAPLEQIEPVHCRNSDKDVEQKALQAWQGRALNLALQEQLPPYDREQITETFLNQVIRLSYYERGPQLAKELLNKKGVHFIVLPHLPQTYLDGACFLTPHGAPVIAMTLRFDRLDYFWFTLAHELGHLYLHLDDPRTAFFDNLEPPRREEAGDIERETDRFARDLLIPPQAWLDAREDLLSAKQAAELERFAEKLNISTAIVAGRVRWELDDYRKHSKLIGGRQVREQFEAYQT